MEKKYPEDKLTFAVADEVAARSTKELGAEFKYILGPHFNIQNAIDFFKVNNFRATVLMGADGLDGSYDPNFSVSQLIMADLASRSGSRTYITGFSISKKFNSLVKIIFNHLHHDIRVNLRDPESFERFKQHCKTKCNLVTDVAFLINPDESVRLKPIIEWIERNQNQEKVVIGINAHPLLLELNERGKLEELTVAISETLEKAAEDRKISFLLMCHDSRGDFFRQLCT